MEKHKLIDKLQSQANISYEEAKNVLEKVNWDILDAILYLEEQGKIQKPSSSIFYTSEHKKDYKNDDSYTEDKQENSYSSTKSNSRFEEFLETVGGVINIGNSILFQIKRGDRVFSKLPITVIVLLLIFAFWVFIPLIIISLFLDFKFSVSRDGEEMTKVNDVFDAISEGIRKLKKGFKDG